jgi:broad specificity phosphatase PhoE
VTSRGVSAAVAVHLVRHGQSTWNADRRVQGQRNPPLTSLGLEQAERAANALPPQVDAVLSSDLERALVTAEIIARRYGLGPVPDGRLREQSLGVLEGRPLADALAVADGHDWTDLDSAIEGGESLRAVYDRLVPLGKEIAAGRYGRSVVVVSHGDTIRVARCALAGMSAEHITDSTLSNGEVLVLPVAPVDDLDRVL